MLERGVRNRIEHKYRGVADHTKRRLGFSMRFMMRKRLNGCVLLCMLVDFFHRGGPIRQIVSQGERRKNKGDVRRQKHVPDEQWNGDPLPVCGFQHDATVHIGDHVNGIE